MSKGMTAKDRALKIELARARAALERQSLVRSARDVGAELRPRALLRSVLPSSGGGTVSHWLAQAVSLTRRYPLLTSGVTAVLSGRGKRRRLLRIAGGLLLSWGITKMAGAKKGASAGSRAGPDPS
ncbi:hypothetical protein [Parapusillimonas granuli]|uniref:YqjK-like protein n=1 Tax=Parapusillimonas granuli TaxID=380911 RepID=A0A853FZG2_9BURK|nr:hypothetical protein [Parapusillimonas granuli]MBB5215159.1 hypothetical protein [Parapusillimonas granuli]NYT49477.1 hypothetical protein [Parapusillimonas granuli]